LQWLLPLNHIPKFTTFVAAKNFGQKPQFSLQKAYPNHQDVLSKPNFAKAWKKGKKSNLVLKANKKKGIMPKKQSYISDHIIHDLDGSDHINNDLDSFILFNS
jgi:hypothetical protein